MTSKTLSKKNGASASSKDEQKNSDALPPTVQTKENLNSMEDNRKDRTYNTENVLTVMAHRGFSVQSLKKVAAELATSVDFFREHAPGIAKMQCLSYTILPQYCQYEENADDETENAFLEARKRLVRDVTNFPFLKKKGRLQIPMALLCEAEGDSQKMLAIINYWRQLTASQQRELKTVMQRFYVRPNVTNERLILVSACTKATTSPSLDGSKASLENQEQLKRQSRLSITPWGFRCLETCTQLAERLGLCRPGENPKLACDLLRTANLEYPKSSCKSEDCIYPALARNNGYCCRHGLHFGPTSGKIKGRRGYLLLGDVYTRPYLVSTTTAGSDSNLQGEKNNIALLSDQVKKLTTCSCRNELCVGIGYSPTMIQFDIHRFPKDLQDSIWRNANGLNMNAKTYFQISRNKNSEEINSEPSTRSSVLRLAPWHFHPEHREFLPDGSWKLLDFFRPNSSPASGTDPDVKNPNTSRKEWKDMPLPTYSPKDFLEEEVMKEYAGRKDIVASTTDMLPPWCREYTKLEEGPSNISEIQRNFLWDHSIRLEKSLASQTLSFRMKERALQSELEKVRSKYNEKKFLKRRDKKRKRINNTSTKTNGTNSCAKSLSSDALQGKNSSDKRNRTKKKRNDRVDKAAPNPPDYLGVRTSEGGDSTKNIEHHDSSSTIQVTHHGDSHRTVQYTNHPRQQHPQQHHRHHPYQHSYPQHLAHQHVHPNLTAPIDFRNSHYHQNPPQQQQQQQRQPQPYPQHNQQTFHHHRHDERANQYRELPQEQHPPQVPQQQQQQRHEDRHYPEQQNWQQGRYYN